MVNWIWTIMIAMGVADFMLSGDSGGINRVLGSSAQNSIKLLIELGGVMAIWSGFMRICERAGLMSVMGRWLSPMLRLLFPGLMNKNPAAMGSIVMNLSTNLLGLSNAATPFGIKAMEELQLVNPDKERASDDMVTFLILNATCVQLLPTTILAIMTSLHATNPMGILLPEILSSFCALVTGLVLCKVLQKVF